MIMTPVLCHTTFDATVMGVYASRDKANRAANVCATHLGRLGYGDTEVTYFVGEGTFLDGTATLGGVNAFSQRVFVKGHAVA